MTEGRGQCVGHVGRIGDGRGHIKIDTGSGGVTIVGPADLGAVVELEAGSGGIETDYTMTLVSKEHGHLQGTIGDGHGRIKVDTGSGGVRLLQH